MNHKEFKVLITTSGTGSRLKELSANKNKALIEVNNKPILAHIIKLYPENTSFVITTGYKSEEVTSYLNKAFPNHDLTFVKIDKYEGPGSSLGYSMLRAKDQLQCPFIFHCNDTLVKDIIPFPDMNWNGGSRGAGLTFQNTQKYSSFMSNYGNMIELNAKGAEEYDYFHVGLVGIHEYKKFWEYLEKLYKNNINDSSLNDVSAINMMIKNGSTFAVKEFTEWFDTGNLEGLEYAKRHFR